MFELVIRIAIVWSIALAAVLATAAARGTSTLARILWVDTLALTLTGTFALIGVLRASAHYLDVALAVALLAFAGTLAAVAYQQHAREP